MLIRSRTPLRILAIAEETQRVHQSGYGSEAVFEEIPTGRWQVALSDLTLLRFSEKPDLAEGDEVYILVEKKNGN